MRFVWSNRKREDGSITIFALILIPSLLLIFFTLYHHIDQKNLKTTALSIASQSSEVRMSKYSGLLYDQYRILAYEDTSQLSDLLVILKSENGLDQDLDYRIHPKTLDQPLAFKEAIIKSAKVEVTKQVLELGVGLLAQYGSLSDQSRKLKEVESFREKFSSTLNVDGFKAFASKVKGLKSVQNIQGAYQDFQSLENNIDLLHTFYQEGQLKRSENDFFNHLEDIESSLEYLDDHLSSLEDKWSILIELSENLEKTEKAIYQVSRTMAQLNLALAEIQSIGQEESQASTSTSAIEIELNRLTTSLSELESIRVNQAEELAQVAVVFETVGDQLKTYFDIGKESSNLLSTLKELGETIEEDFNHQGSRVDEDGFQSLEAIGTLDFGETSVAEGGLIIEYCLGIFRSLDEKSPRNFDFVGLKDERQALEVEYLLSGYGQPTSREDSVSLKVFAIRTMSNALAIVGDSESLKWLQMVSTTLPIPQKFIAQAAIVAVWTSAESYMDLGTIKKGGGIPLIKTMDKFEIQLASRQNTDLKVAIETMAESYMSPKDYLNDQTKKTDDDFLMYYQDYMRLLLYLQDINVTLSRMQALVDLTLENTLNHYASGHQIEIVIGGDQVYVLEKTYE